jgi:hypothetical protein
MRTETEVASGANLIDAVHRGPKEPLPHSSRQRRILWICVLGWTAFVGFALWWLAEGDGGPLVWVFAERDLIEPGFSQKVQAMFRGELGLQRAYPWILFSPYLALMAWYFPLERERFLRNLPLNAAACLAFTWACHATNFPATDKGARLLIAPSPGTATCETNGSSAVPAAGRFVGRDGPIRSRPSPGAFKRPPLPPPSRKVSLRSTILDLLAYGAVTGLTHSVNFYRRLRERERRALLLESNLAKARLNALKAQLQPHFLFNSLNAIAALLRRDPRLAETTLVALSELLRLALSQSERQEGALREELEFVQRYLEIQQTRFGDKLRVEQDIESQALDCVVPTLVLQPLVENAIRHGIEPAEKAGTVRVSASRQDGKLVLAVEDDGVGLASSHVGSGAPENPAGLYAGLPAPARSPTPSAALARAGTGIGLANLRERLQALYGARQKLELMARATGGVIVRVEIPWRPRASS